MTCLRGLQSFTMFVPTCKKQFILIDNMAEEVESDVEREDVMSYWRNKKAWKNFKFLETGKQLN